MASVFSSSFCFYINQQSQQSEKNKYLKNMMQSVITAVNNMFKTSPENPVLRTINPMASILKTQHQVLCLFYLF